MRSIWSGTISFGLVNVPVKLYTAVRENAIHFHLLGPDGKCRLRRKLVCPETGKEVEWKETKRGYEISPDQYVVVDDQELGRLKPEASRSIDIQDFVDLSEIDPVYYGDSYYLAPDQRAGKAFRLLHDAMARSKRVGIATFVMRQKQHLAAIRPVGQIMMLATMHYADEIVPAIDLEESGSDAKVDKRELEMANRLIETLSGPFDPSKYKDDYREEVMKLIESKSEGGEVYIPPSHEEPAKVRTLVKALEESLAAAKRRHQPLRESRRTAHHPSRKKRP
jgi:DNA end-binding protein Ku